MQWCQRLDADYGVDPWIWQSLHGPSFHLSSKLCLCNSFHGCFVPKSKEGHSVHTSVFILLEFHVFSKLYCSTMFIAALFIIARSWKEPRCPSTEEWIQTIWYICTVEYYLDTKNNEFMKFLGKRMDLENIFLSSVTQSQKNTHDMHSLISGY